jgi:hypothetical protein
LINRIERLSGYHSEVTYTVEATGPGCNEVEPAVSSDFPVVLKSLVELAESKR